MAADIAPPSGTVTFLFTDVEGSTQLWEQNPAAMQDALDRHDGIIRSFVGDHGGYVFTTAGDSFAVAFGSASDAVAAAADTQRALGEVSWPSAAEIRVRMGIHTGEADERDGDYFGTTVNRAARLMALGHGGQVLVSESSAGLLEGSELVSLGAHRLKDLSDPVGVFELRASGLDGEFPPLRSFDGCPGNLPEQVSSFVGRDAEVGAVVDELDRSRLVTVVGPGGVGKTRLAVQVAAEMSDRFPAGVWLCELAPVSDELGILRAVLSVIDRDPGSEAVPAALVDAIGDREMLVILDNCEHVLRDAARVTEAALAGCASLRVLATSREPLGAQGETTWPLRPLACDGPNPHAAELFAERARAAGATDVEISTEGVAELVRQLDGLPLAIELAAGRVRSFTPEELVKMLDERFRLLRARHDDAARHGTLEGAIGWSYDLLLDAERELFQRLAVLRGRVSLDTVVEVCAQPSLDRFGVADVLASLVDKSLIVAGKRDGRTSYALMESLRHYATDRLEEAAQADIMRRRHAEAFLVLAEHVGGELRYTKESWDRWYRFVTEHDNLAAAATWAADGAADDLADRLSEAASRARFAVSLQGLGLTPRYLADDDPDTDDQRERRLRLQLEALPSFVDLCKELTQSQWDLATDCDRWTVKDIISHVCGMLANFVGDPLPPVELPREFDARSENPFLSEDPMYPMVNTLAEMHVQARRGWPPVAILADLERLVEARLRHERDGVALGHVPGRAMEEAVAVLAYDAWIHEQDIRRAAGLPGNLDGYMADQSIQRGIATLPFVVGTRTGATDGTRIEVEITDPIPQKIAIAMRGGRATITDPGPDPTVRLTVDAETFCCLGAGRWRARDAVDHGAMIIGDRELAMRLCDAMWYVP